MIITTPFLASSSHNNHTLCGSTVYTLPSPFGELYWTIRKLVRALYFFFFMVALIIYITFGSHIQHFFPGTTMRITLRFRIILCVDDITPYRIFGFKCRPISIMKIRSEQHKYGTNWTLRQKSLWGRLKGDRSVWPYGEQLLSQRKKVIWRSTRSFFWFRWCLEHSQRLFICIELT